MKSTSSKEIFGFRARLQIGNLDFKTLVLIFQSNTPLYIIVLGEKGRKTT